MDNSCTYTPVYNTLHLTPIKLVDNGCTYTLVYSTAASKNSPNHLFAFILTFEFVFLFVFVFVFVFIFIFVFVFVFVFVGNLVLVQKYSSQILFYLPSRLQC